LKIIFFKPHRFLKPVRFLKPARPNLPFLLNFGAYQSLDTFKKTL